MVSQNPFPLMPSKSTALRLSSFDEYVYTGTPSTILYRYVNALCGSSGAGALVNEIFLARLSGALETIYFNDLDYIFGKINFLARSPAESYPYNPMQDMLTSAQWSEVRQKDAWYRARIKDFFTACSLGGTPNGIRMAVQAALAVDCDIYEVWRYIDDYGITEQLGRAPISARNEVVVQPHKSTLASDELRLIRDMLNKLGPLDTIYTVNLQGLAVSSPVTVNAAASDSTYFEVQQMVTATPALANLPAPQLLPIDLLPTETWLYEAQTDPTLAPYTAFNISSEYSYYYLVGGGSRSPIDSVTYGTIELGRTGVITVYEVSGTSIQVTAEGIVDKLEDDLADFLSWLGGVFTPPGGIQFPPLFPGPGAGYFATNLNPDEFSYVGIPYPAVSFPLLDAVATAQNTLVAAITASPGPFILIGTSQGAVVVSNVYDMIRTGSLSNRSTDLLAGIVFSNPRRQEGHDFPNYPDPGGHGVLSPQLTNSDPFWWEFAQPGDPVACNTDDSTGTLRSGVFNSLYETYTGAPSALVSILDGLGSTVMSVLSSINDFYANVTGTNVAYGDWQPIPGDTRSAYQIALDYIQTFANLPNANPNPMSTYRPENNYQVFDTTGQYTAPIPYAIADSPDNYPGGKYGIHPDEAPALNPDGTPYSFPWPSQEAYVAAQVVAITNEGGIANATSYQLPLAPISSSAQVFYPDYAIAYYPPAKDSTISTSITARHGDPTGQLTPDARNPVNFVRSS